MHTPTKERLHDLSELNHTVDFKNFFNAVEPMTRSLPLLLHSKEEILELLLSHLAKTESMAVKELLE